MCDETRLKTIFLLFEEIISVSTKFLLNNMYIRHYSGKDLMTNKSHLMVFRFNGSFNTKMLSVIITVEFVKRGVYKCDWTDTTKNLSVGRKKKIFKYLKNNFKFIYFI